MKITLKSSLISFTIGVAFIAALFALQGWIMDFNSVVLLGLYMALLGIGYYFVRKISAAKPLCFVGMLIGTIVFYNIYINAVSDTEFLAGIEYSVLLVGLIPILCFDALILVVSAMIWFVRSRKKDGESDVTAPSTKKLILPLLIPFFVVLASFWLMYFQDDALIWLTAPPILAYIYFYFKRYCKTEWIYTLVLAVPYTITFVVMLILSRFVFLWLPYDDKIDYVMVALLTMLAVDAVTMLIKKISKKRKLPTCKNKQNLVQL